jgi:hypothetical protein
VATLILCYFSIKSYNRLVTCNNKMTLRGEGGREGGRRDKREGERELGSIKVN